METFSKEAEVEPEKESDAQESADETNETPETEALHAIADENADIVAGDRIFGEIMGSINDGWDALSETKRKEVVTMLSNLIEALRIYHDSYTNLKFASAPERRMLQQTDPEKYQEAVMAADKRETILHNSFIDSVNILSRNMKKLGLSNAWRQDDDLYSTDHYTTRQKLKAWMFHLFREKV